jgi:hypothetical protein
MQIPARSDLEGTAIRIPLLPSACPIRFSDAAMVHQKGYTLATPNLRQDGAVWAPLDFSSHQILSQFLGPKFEIKFPD